jgi:hypothetical protein
MKKGTITLERDTQIFSGYVVTPIPLLFKPGALFGKYLSESLHRQGNKTICLFHRATGFVNESCLNRVPPAPQIVKFGIGK